MRGLNMREKEAGSSQGALYMGPLVKHDLARLDKDRESRRSAMNSLKLFVESLDPGSMPRFLAQVSETRDQGASRSYAVSLYEEVARVHGKLIIPHIPRVMATVTRSLSSSGSSPQLHQACAKVVSAVARYSVDGGSRVQADEILRELCNPLLGVLVGKLEPLAAGAAVCLQALVESEKWKYASDEVVNETCLRTTVALGEKATRTVAHLQLARSLATTCPSFFTSYGVALMRTGSEVLRQGPASGTWQQRACAARLLQVVLPTVDRATFDSELEHTIQALDECKHDRMAHVRMAVSEALKTAKMLCSHDSRVRFVGQDPSPDTQSLSSVAVEAKQPKSPSSEMRSLLGGTEDVFTCGSKQRSSHDDFPEDNTIFPFLPCGSPELSKSAQRSRLGKHRRLSLSPTSLIPKACSAQTSSVSCVDDLEGFFNPGRSCEVQANENMPSRNLDLTAGVPCDSGPSSCGSSCSGQVGKHVCPRPTTRRFNIFYPPLLGDEMGTDQQPSDIERTSLVMSRGRGGMAYRSLENSVVMVYREQEGVGIRLEEEDVSSNSTDVDIEVETGTEYNQCLPSKESRFNQVDYHNSSRLVSNSSKSSQSQTMLNRPTRKNVSELEGSAAHTTIQSVCAHGVDGLCASRGAFVSHLYKEPLNCLCHQDGLLPQLQSLEVVSGPNKSRVLITAEDFLPFSTPRRLVRSLQSNLPTTPSSGTVKDQDTKLQNEGANMASMDLETYTDARWSVRDNPIVSDKTDSEEDQEQQGTPRKNRNVDSSKRSCAADLDANHLYTSNCERLSLVFLHAADSLFCTSTGRALESKFPAEYVEITESKLDHNRNTFSNASAHSQEATDTCLTHEPCQDMAIGVLWIRFCHSFRGIFGENFRSLQVLTEIFLSGFLLVTLALPFAMVMSRMLRSHLDHPGLIPT